MAAVYLFSALVILLLPAAFAQSGASAARSFFTSYVAATDDGILVDALVAQPYQPADYYEANGTVDAATMHDGRCRRHMERSLRSTATTSSSIEHLSAGACHRVKIIDINSTTSNSLSASQVTTLGDIQSRIERRRNQTTQKAPLVADAAKPDRGMDRSLVALIMMIVAALTML